jgi:hypothetical protein
MAESALVFWWIKLGLGRHEITVPVEDLAQAGQDCFREWLPVQHRLCIPKVLGHLLLPPHLKQDKSIALCVHVGGWRPESSMAPH